MLFGEKYHLSPHSASNSLFVVLSKQTSNSLPVDHIVGVKPTFNSVLINSIIRDCSHLTEGKDYLFQKDTLESSFYSWIINNYFGSLSDPTFFGYL